MSKCFVNPDKLGTMIQPYKRLLAILLRPSCVSVSISNEYLSLAEPVGAFMLRAGPPGRVPQRSFQRMLTPYAHDLGGVVLGCEHVPLLAGAMERPQEAASLHALLEALRGVPGLTLLAPSHTREAALPSLGLADACSAHNHPPVSATPTAAGQQQESFVSPQLLPPQRHSALHENAAAPSLPSCSHMQRSGPADRDHASSEGQLRTPGTSPSHHLAHDPTLLYGPAGLPMAWWDRWDPSAPASCRILTVPPAELPAASQPLHPAAETMSSAPAEEFMVAQAEGGSGQQAPAAAPPGGGRQGLSPEGSSTGGGGSGASGSSLQPQVGGAVCSMATLFLQHYLDSLGSQNTFG